MAKMIVVLMAALLAASAFAQCPAPATTAFSSLPTCPEAQRCEAQLCGCASAGSSSNTACLRNTSSTTFNCATMGTCFSGYIRCLTTLVNSARSNQTSLCNMWAMTVHAQVLQAATGSYEGSNIQKDCAAAACNLRNTTGQTTCDLGGVNYTTVCSYNNVIAPGTTTTSPNSPPTTSSASGVSLAVAAVLAAVAALL